MSSAENTRLQFITSRKFRKVAAPLRLITSWRQFELTQGTFMLLYHTFVDNLSPVMSHFLHKSGFAHTRRRSHNYPFGSKSVLVFIENICVVRLLRLWGTQLRFVPLSPKRVDNRFGRVRQ